MGFANRLLPTHRLFAQSPEGADDAIELIKAIDRSLHNPDLEMQSDLQYGKFMAHRENNGDRRYSTVTCFRGRSHIGTLNLQPELLPVKHGCSLSSVVAGGEISWRALRHGPNSMLGNGLLILCFGVYPLGERYGRRWLGSTHHTKEVIEWEFNTTLILSADPSSIWKYKLEFERA